MLTQQAIHFFSARKNEEMCQILGKAFTGVVQPLNTLDFIRYIGLANLLPESDRFTHRIEEHLTLLADRQILKTYGATGALWKSYLFFKELTNKESSGWLWLSAALGPEFIRSQFASAIVQLCGRDTNNDVRSGTGLVIAPRLLLTCAHVVKGMQLDRTQEIYGSRFEVVHVHAHHDVDVAIVVTSTDLPLLQGMSLRDPRLSEEIFTLGFPRIPRTREPALLMHRGEITCESVIDFSGQQKVLYSAIARPGNSGGPIISSTGHVVGIVSESLEDQALGSVAPFYAGVRPTEIESALSDLGYPNILPIEDYS